MRGEQLRAGLQKLADKPGWDQEEFHGISRKHRSLGDRNKLQKAVDRKGSRVCLAFQITFFS